MHVSAPRISRPPSCLLACLVKRDALITIDETGARQQRQAAFHWRRHATSHICTAAAATVAAAVAAPAAAAAFSTLFYVPAWISILMGEWCKCVCWRRPTAILIVFFMILPFGAGIIRFRERVQIA
eukprot:6009263-Pleurochrysis_carterae.AAC.1